MKPIQLKILISAIVLIVGVVLIRLFLFENVADQKGTIYLTITGENEEIVFEGELEFYEGDSFYDLLDRSFDLTCGTATYQPDESCSYTFNSILYQGKVILGIKNDEFDLITNWSDTFLSFYYIEDGEKKLATVGPSRLAFEDQDEILISYENVWE
jgi:hypothetical protein